MNDAFVPLFARANAAPDGGRSSAPLNVLPAEQTAAQFRPLQRLSLPPPRLFRPG